MTRFGLLGIILSFFLTFLHALDAGEALALRDLFISLDGENWMDNNGWLSQSEPCEWEGVICDEDGGHVIELGLKGNKLKGQVPSSIGNFTKIVKLFLDENKITTVPRTICNSKDLRELELDSNLLREIPEQIGSCSQLRTLMLENNRLASLPSSIGDLKRLDILQLHSNNLDELPDSIGGLVELELLNLSNNDLDDLPTEMSNLSDLAYLNLMSNKLSDIDFNIGNLTNLVTLHLCDNNLRSLPDMSGLSALEELYAQNNRLKELPQSIKQMASLKIIDLRDNLLTSAPFAFSELRDLQEIYLDTNPITSFPEGLSGDSNPKLRFLSMQHCALEGSIPDRIMTFTNLNWLDISRNNLNGTLPEQSKFEKLQYFDLSMNKLSGRIPKYLGLPSQLKAQGNHFTCPVPANLNGRMQCNELPIVTGIFPQCAKVGQERLVKVSTQMQVDENSAEAKCKFGSIETEAIALFENEVFCMAPSFSSAKSVKITVKIYGDEYSAQTADYSVTDECRASNVSLPTFSGFTTRYFSDSTSGTTSSSMSNKGGSSSSNHGNLLMLSGIIMGCLGGVLLIVAVAIGVYIRRAERMNQSSRTERLLSEEGGEETDEL